MGTSSEIETRTLEQVALLHGDMDAFLSYLIPFVRAGTENREPAFVAVGVNHLAALRDAVGAGAPGVTWADTRKWHPNSSTRLRAFHEYVTERVADGATGIRLIGEPEWYEARPDLIREWTRYESVLNMVLATFPVSFGWTQRSWRTRGARIRWSPTEKKRQARTSRTPPSCSARGTRSRHLLRRRPQASTAPRTFPRPDCSCGKRP